MRRTGIALLALALLAAAGTERLRRRRGRRSRRPICCPREDHPRRGEQRALRPGAARARRRPARLLVGGEGDIARPASFEGTLKVRALGSTLDLEVVSVDGTVYAQLPFTSGFSVVDPAQFGFGDPGALLDPETGISQLLGRGGVRRAGGGEPGRRRGRARGDRRMPGDLVEQILTSADPSHARCRRGSRSPPRAASCAGPS